MARIAWLGLGGIGKAICLNIVKYGQYEESVVVWNRTHQTAVDFASEAAKIVVVGSVAEAVAVCDIICLCLADDAAVNQVVDAAIETADIPGKLFVDLSTIHPNTATELHSKLKLHGADYLASPIFGGVPLAVHRQITLVLAGSSEAIERFRPFTDGVICKNSILLRNQPCRQASILKLIGNYIRLSAIRSLCEGLALSEVLGLAPQTLASFTETMNTSPTPQQIQMLLSGEYYKGTKVSKEFLKQYWS
ncbi:hypothetical protein VHEMI06459 [[Torrubiella] hemipterigena]|uniref:6-phosphogluconate dehydrogenase NADP-binding domain-containing protein n=1 Tax=[Torrubiella] hemipterigena TaxID=1531966 RepID=A0A0A1TJ88_9HYPO|nr:hypothetical protein VHEMI06459 [[Torrubiella] hemipterigena]